MDGFINILTDTDGLSGQELPSMYLLQKLYGDPKFRKERFHVKSLGLPKQEVEIFQSELETHKQLFFRILQRQSNLRMMKQELHDLRRNERIVNDIREKEIQVGENETLEQICFDAILNQPYKNEDSDSKKEETTELTSQKEESQKLFDDISSNSIGDNSSLWRQVDDVNSEQMMTVMSQPSIVSSQSPKHRLPRRAKGQNQFDSLATSYSACVEDLFSPQSVEIIKNESQWPQEESKEYSYKGFRREGIFSSILHLYDCFYLLACMNFIPHTSLQQVSSAHFQFIDLLAITASKQMLSLLDVYISLVFNLYLEAISSKKGEILLCCNPLTWPHVLRVIYMKEFQASKKTVKQDLEMSWVQKFIMDSKMIKELSLPERIDLCWWIIEKLEGLREFKAIPTKHNDRIKKFLTAVSGNKQTGDDKNSYDSRIFERQRSIIQFSPFFPDTNIPRVLSTCIQEKPYIGKVGKGKLALYSFHFDQERIYVRYSRNRRFEWLTVKLDQFSQFKREEFDELLPPDKLEERMQCMKKNQQLLNQLSISQRFQHWKHYWTRQSEKVILADYITQHFAYYVEEEYLEQKQSEQKSNLKNLQLFPIFLHQHDQSILQSICSFLQAQLILLLDILENLKKEQPHTLEFTDSPPSLQQLVLAVRKIVKEQSLILIGPKKDMLLVQNQHLDYSAAAFMVFTLDQIIQYWRKDTELQGIFTQDNASLRNLQTFLIHRANPEQGDDKTCFICGEEEKEELNRCARCQRYFHEQCSTRNTNSVSTLDAPQLSECLECRENWIKEADTFEMPHEAPECFIFTGDTMASIPQPQILRTYEEYIERDQNDQIK